MDFTAVRTSHQRRWLQDIVFWLDARLRKHNNVYEYSAHPDCLLRIQRDRAGRDFRFSDGSLLKASDSVITLHLWNEHMPLVADEGPTIAWARRTKRAVDLSLEQLAAHIASRRRYDDIRAIKIVVGLGPDERMPGMVRIAAHCGFEPVVQNGEALTLAQRLYRIGQNILGLLFALAANPVTARLSVLRPGRAVAYMSRKVLERRYGRTNSS